MLETLCAARLIRALDCFASRTTISDMTNNYPCTVLSVLLLLLSVPVLVVGQDKCGLVQPLTAGVLKGKVLFDYNGALFAIKEAEIDLSVKGEAAFEVITHTSTDGDGRFHLKGTKPGKYFLSISPARLPSINLMEINVVSTLVGASDSEIEFVIGEDSRKQCGGGHVRTIAVPEKNLSGRSETPEWEGISEISLERTGCFGSCPIYKAVLRKDGTVIYIGKDFVTRKGLWKGKLVYGFSSLAELIYRSGFFNLRDKYEAPYTDLDTSLISVVRDDKRKTVTNYGGEAPIEVWGIEKAIEALVANVEWQKSQVPAKKSKGSRKRRNPTSAWSGLAMSGSLWQVAWASRSSAALDAPLIRIWGLPLSGSC